MASLLAASQPTIGWPIRRLPPGSSQRQRIKTSGSLAHGEKSAETLVRAYSPGTGFTAATGRHLSRGYLAVAATALALTVSALALMFLAGSHPAIAEPEGQPRTWQPPTSSWMNVHAPVPRQRSRSASLF